MTKKLEISTEVCVLHPDRRATTTAAQILVCGECYERYAEEGRRYLPENERVFWRELQEKEEQS